MKLYTNRGKEWEMRNSFWVLFPVLSLGLLGFVAFLYIGIKLNNKRWALYSIAYLIPVIIAFIVPSDDIMAAIGIAVWAVSSIHALKIRPLYLIELDVKEEIEKEQLRTIREQIRSKYMNHASTTEYAATNTSAQYGAPFRKNMETTPAQEQPANAETSHSLRFDSEQQPGVRTVTNGQADAQTPPREDRPERKETASPIKTTGPEKTTTPKEGPEPEASAEPGKTAGHRPQTDRTEPAGHRPKAAQTKPAGHRPQTARTEPTAAELQTAATQTPPVSGTETETAATGKLDLNKASEEEIASIPAVGRILAKRIVAKRQELGGFTSFEQFVETVGLKPHTAEKLKPLVTFSPVKKEPRRGRIIDY